jgi:Zn-dependent protease with chaperone function
MNPSQVPDLFKTLCQRVGINAKVEIVDSSDPGAWTDGKDVQITTATLQSLNEAQVAAILGHELGHVMLNHLTSNERELSYLRSRLSSSLPPGFAGVVASALIEARLAGATAERSRNQELQADQIGEALARTVGSAKGSMGSALESIAPNHEATRLMDTHPSTPCRVERLESNRLPRLRIRLVRTSRKQNM